jgi:hypothetical protein
MPKTLKSGRPKRTQAGAGRSNRGGKARKPTAVRSPSLFDLFSLRNGWLVWVATLMASLALFAYPESSPATRQGSLVLAGIVVFGLLGLLWRYRVPRFLLLFVYSCAALFWVLPGRDYDALALRTETVLALLRYEDAVYRPKGEGVLGVDGAGLIRRGAVDAMALTGLRTLNPALLRRAADLWWRDLTVSDLSNGARRAARRVFEARSVDALDDDKLHAGDYVVTFDGLQIAAYLGDQKWICIEPPNERVMVTNAKNPALPWLQKPVFLMRWRHLDAQPSTPGGRS